MFAKRLALQLERTRAATVRRRRNHCLTATTQRDTSMSACHQRTKVRTFVNLSLLQPVTFPLMQFQFRTLASAYDTKPKKVDKRAKRKKQRSKPKDQGGKRDAKHRRISSKKKRALNSIDYSMHPDYPVPKSSVLEEEVVVNTKSKAPPLMMQRTASPFVFLAESCRVDPKSLMTINFDEFSLSGAFRSFCPADFPSLPYPDTDQPEVCFLGRSNVGKSSLINALIGGKTDLAITSKRPGRTQRAHYYGLVPAQYIKQYKAEASRGGLPSTSSSSSSSKQPFNPAFCVGFLVDLPGYGFAVGPHKVVQEWQTETQEYLLQRRDAGNLRRLYLLQDARLGEPQSIDNDVCNWLDSADIPYTIVLTKADRGSSSPKVIKHANLASLRYHVRRAEAQTEQRMPNVAPTVHVSSSAKNIGIAELLYSVQMEFATEEGKRTDDYEEDEEDEEIYIEGSGVAATDVEAGAEETETWEVFNAEGLRRVKELNDERDARLKLEKMKAKGRWRGGRR